MFSSALITYYLSSSAPVISQAHMEKFVISNPALKQLEFEYVSPGLFPALIHCLSLLYQQGRGLEELVLNLLPLIPGMLETSLHDYETFPIAMVPLWCCHHCIVPTYVTKTC